MSKKTKTPLPPEVSEVEYNELLSDLKKLIRESSARAAAIYKEAGIEIPPREEINAAIKEFEDELEREEILAKEVRKKTVPMRRVKAKV